MGRTISRSIAVAVLFILPPAVVWSHTACDETGVDAAAVADARAEVAATCSCAAAASHGDYVRCAAHVIKSRVQDGRLNRSCGRAVQGCVRRSTCGRPDAVTCCRTTADGVTRCSVKRESSLCRAPRRGTVSIEQVASCCDACPPSNSVTTTTTTASTSTTQPRTGHIGTVFIILMENHSWAEVKDAPYIASLARMGAHAENYKTAFHPSEPNYVILEAGTNCPPLANGSAGHCFTSDADATGSNHTASPFHLTRYLRDASISWKAYLEDIPGSNCPLTSVGGYAPKHAGMIFFDDNTGGSTPSDPYCIAHFRPYSELAADLQNNTTGRYNFIGPNLCHDMHDCSVSVGDQWLAAEVPHILNSPAFADGGALFLTWDEDSGTPIGMVVVSPFAAVGRSNVIAYSHASTVRTLQEIFGVDPPTYPWLGDASTATDLKDLFTSFP